MVPVAALAVVFVPEYIVNGVAVLEYSSHRQEGINKRTQQDNVLCGVSSVHPSFQGQSVRDMGEGHFLLKSCRIIRMFRCVSSPKTEIQCDPGLDVRLFAGD